MNQFGVLHKKPGVKLLEVLSLNMCMHKCNLKALSGEKDSQKRNFGLLLIVDTFIKKYLYT